jgi:amidase
LTEILSMLRLLWWDAAASGARHAPRAQARQVVGLKPTFGLASHFAVGFAAEPSVDHVGPMARTVADVAAALQAVAGYDEYDPRQRQCHPAAARGVPDTVRALPPASIPGEQIRDSRDAAPTGRAARAHVTGIRLARPGPGISCELVLRCAKRRSFGNWTTLDRGRPACQPSP